MKFSGTPFLSFRSLLFSTFSILKNGLYYAHLLSLDVALGAVASHLMVKRLLDLPLYPMGEALILGSTVFLVYTLDRLGDVRRLTVTPITPRHRFHFRHQWLLWRVVIGGILLTGFAALKWLSPSVILFGVELGVLVAAYLLLVYLLGQRGRKWFHKEPLVAVLYTAGVWGSAFVLSDTLLLVDYVLGVVFMLIAFQNLLLFSLFELETDLRKRERSLPAYWGARKTQRILNALFGIIIGLIILAAAMIDQAMMKQMVEWKVLAVELVMTGVLFGLGCYPAFFYQDGRYRWIGDGVFLLPMLVCLS